MKNSFPTLKLPNGRDMPVMGFGCADFNDDKIVQKAVEIGLEFGYRFFDNAPFYKDEAAVGAALRDNSVPREDLFISTKLPNSSHAYDDALRAFETSMKTMQVDYFDMYMIHFPCPQQDLYCEAWKALEKLYEQKLVRGIGLSNFKEHHILKILSMCNVGPMVNEMECNPYFSQNELRGFCIQHKIQPIAWFPLGGPVGAIEVPPSGEYAIDDPIAIILAELRENNKGKYNKVLLRDQTARIIGEKYGKSIAQVVLRWHIQSGIIPIPKSKNPNRLIENSNIFNFALDEEDMKLMNALNHDRRLGPDPDLYSDHAV